MKTIETLRDEMTKTFGGGSPAMLEAILGCIQVARKEGALEMREDVAALADYFDINVKGGPFGNIIRSIAVDVS
tara:strand:- start:99 stop:320 length:222 start_codon:yes stop_codon:yes gene_type:complete